MKTKLILTKLLGTTLLIPTFFLTSCGNLIHFISKQIFNIDDGINNPANYNSYYFLNLLAKHYEEFNAKSGTFSALNMFYNQPEKQRDKYLFLGEKSKITIKNLEQFQKNIVNRTEEIIKNNPNFAKFNTSELKLEFEDKFLKGDLLEKVLEKNNIIIMERGEYWMQTRVSHYYFEENGSSNIIATRLVPDYVIEGTLVQPAMNFDDSPFFNVIVYPKNKTITFREIDGGIYTGDNIIDYEEHKKLKILTEREARKIYNKLAKKYNLPKNKISTSSPFFMSSIINFSQKINNIKTLKPKILDLITDKINPWSNSFLQKKHAIIKNIDEFKATIIDRILKLDPELKIDQNDLISDFEQKFLKGEKLDQFLKNNNIFIYETWERIGYESFWRLTPDPIPDPADVPRRVEWEKLLLRKTENNNIFLTTIFQTDLTLNFVRSPESSFDKVAFQILAFPKDKNIVFDKNVSRLELIEDLKNNYLDKYEEKDKQTVNNDV
ncbi:hypothetical protein Q4504_00340 [Mesomycoplasma ovipneumoniae]|uniref:hypothetical protein n=1 Tax=Mesomycoplasma ovipneumoniae TaxID=29562 RepID=UPI0026E217D0|nr:hypothetical protein [Mesomycoplasma ovipneumoniae]MDO6856916.1 hypothetical protein [Mesomycoplasma ovipneumoniae]MDW2926521.1 hypothetical protein [Mesomycoplasma ovipneumoniae]WNM16499.1 hypothetical protein RNM19_03985 [Mesomycoplasma ovipneumoniae]